MSEWEHMKIEESLLSEISRLCELVNEMRGRFEGIAEYWNRDQNETAMADALWHIINESTDAIAKADAILKDSCEPVKYGCHCDIENMPYGFTPDECVIDRGDFDDCIYSKRISRKEDCKYWKPIK